MAEVLQINPHPVRKRRKSYPKPYPEVLAKLDSSQRAIIIFFMLVSALLSIFIPVYFAAL
jgi:hypothetical protein